MQVPVAGGPKAAGPGGFASEWDQKEMSFTEHLRELRHRLLIAIGTVFGLAIVLFWPSQYIIPLMTRAYFKGVQLHAFGPADVIMVEFKFSIYAAIVIGLPVLLYQLWMFVVPAFHPDRKSTRLNSSHMSISYAVFCL